MIRAQSGVVVLLTGLLGVLGAVRAHAEPLVRWVHSTDHTHVEVSGLAAAGFAAVADWTPEKWSELLTVSVQQQPEVQMLGEWKADSAAHIVSFAPKFPLTVGVAYRAVFDASRWPGESEVTLFIGSVFTAPPRARGPATVVANVFPSAAEVPENLLKFYLHFSAPMSRGRIYEQIHLRNEAGKDIELPFLEIDEELWDPEMKRLTLFIDPGRIKREVRPLEEIGPALEQGHRFTLVIDAAWLDATGRPLAKKFEHSFRVGPPDRDPIVPSEWKLTKPIVGSTAPLDVVFPEPMDHALALRLLRIERDDGSRIEGVSALTDSERRWSFVPSNPWRPGVHQLVIPAALEDLAGNNVGKAFEVELIEGAPTREAGKQVKLPFEVK